MTPFKLTIFMNNYYHCKDRESKECILTFGLYRIPISRWCRIWDIWFWFTNYSGNTIWKLQRIYRILGTTLVGVYKVLSDLIFPQSWPFLFPIPSSLPFFPTWFSNFYPTRLIFSPSPGHGERGIQNFFHPCILIQGLIHWLSLPMSSAMAVIY